MKVDIVLGLATLWAVGVGVAFWAALRLTARGHQRDRRDRLGLDSPTDGGKDHPRPRALVQHVGARILQRWPLEGKSTARLIDGSGLTGKITVAEMMGWRACAASFGLAAGGIVVLLFGSRAWVTVPAFVLLGWFGPQLTLFRCRDAYRRDVGRSLTTVMDMLALSMEAGMGLDRA
ncbi:MAG: Type secretion system family protein, partial [Chloroflexi bacterium]|nr:Type secretion system family protein [Chloroflexota bacterium]